MNQNFKAIKNNLKSKIKYFIWKIQNLRKPFSDYYTKLEINSLNCKFPHPTLGSLHSDELKYKNTAKIEKDFLIKRGLLPEHKFIDYGCGSLRLGKELIPYLNKGNYVGLDLVSDFFEIGLKLIDVNLLEDKLPVCAIINSEKGIERYKLSADYLMSCAVLIHIPEKEIESYFRNILKLLKPDGKAYIEFTSSDKNIKIAGATWFYSVDKVREIANKTGAKFDVIDLNKNELKWYQKGHKIIELRNA